MVSLEEIKEFCKGKNIIIVGNSSRILNERHGKLIDSYDIVVRINKGYLHRQNIYSDKIGNKTTILSLGLKSATLSANVIQSNTVKYLMSPIIYSERLNYANVYDVQEDTYNDLKNSLGGFKPSTGISTYNFFNRHTDFNKLDLIGFDFFESSIRQRNQLGHCYVEDHHGKKEFKFFETSKDPEKTKLHIINGSNSAVINNIPVYNQSNIIVNQIKKNNQQPR
tara:strand:- start:398 stop:1066 length:669 start_codon:yes stop_codon:yes gene_type:complete